MSGNEKRRGGVRGSIKKQFALIFMLVLAGTILLCFLINQFCLQRFYIYHKTQVLFHTYDMIAEHVRSEELNSEEFILELEKVIGRYNLDILVMNENAVPLLYTTSDA